MNRNVLWELYISLGKLIYGETFFTIKNIKDDSELAKSINTCIKYFNNQKLFWEDTEKKIARRVNNENRVGNKVGD